jgi:hypothetical protein
MALPGITLDDRSFDQLFAFMRKQIDAENYTDHNYSDPGIALLDLLCWIGEAILYQADRIPERHFEKFADLILDAPEPVTVPLTLTATLAASRIQDVVVPPGTQFASAFAPPVISDRAASSPDARRRIVFETLKPAVFRAGQITQAVVVMARECLIVKDEEIGTSSGAPNQVFPLRPVHADLGLAPGALAFALVDFANNPASEYKPNPAVVVDDGHTKQSWQCKQSLLTEESWVEKNPPANHFIVDQGNGRICFGDGVFGAIPPKDAKLTCTYRLLRGPDARLASGSNLDVLVPLADLGAGEKIVITTGAAAGGGSFFHPDERLRDGLAKFRRPYRLITAGDFERVMMVDFNNFQDLVRGPRALRASARMNYRPNKSSPGCVTLTVLAEQQGIDLDTALTAPGRADEKAQRVKLSKQFSDAVERFLDQRRLVGTRIFVQAPRLVFVSIDARVTVLSDRDAAEMKKAIETRIRAFLGVLRGGPDGTGWPLGGNLYRSKLYRLIEDMDGVDFVDEVTLTLSPADGFRDPLSLPAVDRLNVTAMRG